MPSPTWLAWQRRLDMVYLIFFLVHIFIMLSKCLPKPGPPVLQLPSNQITYYPLSPPLPSLSSHTHLTPPSAVVLYPLYPTRLIPTLLTDIRKWYIATYNDRFFTDPPRWFTLFTVMEAVYHVPVAVTSVGGLWRGEGGLGFFFGLLFSRTRESLCICFGTFVGNVCVSVRFWCICSHLESGCCTMGRTGL